MNFNSCLFLTTNHLENMHEVSEWMLGHVTKLRIANIKKLEFEKLEKLKKKFVLPIEV